MYPEIEPYAHGMLSIGGDDFIYWEECGNPEGKSAVTLHGGPGSGCTPWWRRLFDPEKYRIVLFDQRGCGRSQPYAGDYSTSLAGNNTQNLVSDIEQLRRHLSVDSWLVLGGSWGSTLALTYAEANPDHVSEMVLFGVTTGRHSEMDWLFRGGISIFFPEQWEKLVSALPDRMREEDIVTAYSILLNDPDPLIRKDAAHAWCMWESATPYWPPINRRADRFRDERFVYAFSRLVTHYISQNAWLEDGLLLRNAGALSKIPCVLVNGRFDFQAPIGNAWTLKKAWPRAELVIVDDAGHAAGDAVAAELVKATDRFSAL